MKTKLTILLMTCVLMAQAQKNKLKSVPTYTNIQNQNKKDTIPGIVFAQLHIAATFIVGKLAMDSIKDRYQDTYFVMRMAGCVAQNMAFGKVYNETECNNKISRHKEYLNVFCPEPKEEFDRQIKLVYKMVKNNWQLILNRAVKLPLREDAAKWALDAL